MTAPLIAPVIPSPAAARPPARRPLPGPAARGPARLAARRRLPGTWCTGSAGSTRSGRVADRAVIGALGWRGGDRLTLTAEAGVMIVRRDPGGMVTVPARPYVVIPAALRHRCGLRAGDRVLLPRSPARTRWPRTRSRWWTRPCARTPRSRHVRRRPMTSPPDARSPRPSRLWWRRRWCCWSGWACPPPT